MWRNRLNKYAIPLSLALVTAAAPALAEDPAAPLQTQQRRQRKNSRGTGCQVPSRAPSP
ncbi:hypothetical protein [Defluviicoccus vanus]|uniref:hypothetical protein n=1 Tax=Defluviicoccus vanus TaxID=111831 RepID=UPI001CBA63D6|nr:hypothetical protein [Defluviicoccus vanus]